MQIDERPFSRAACTAGMSRAINMPMIAITTNNSTSVNPDRRFILHLCCFQSPWDLAPAIAMLSQFSGRSKSFPPRRGFGWHVPEPAKGVLTPRARPSQAQGRGTQFAASRSLAHAAGDGEGHFQGLFVVQPRIDLAGIGPAQVGLAQPAGAADALGHVFAGQFDMHPAQMRAEFRWMSRAWSSSSRMSSKERVLTPDAGHQRVAVHRVAAPGDCRPRRRTASTSGGRHSAIRFTPKRWISVKRPGSFVRVEHVDQLQQFVGRHRQARPSRRSGLAMPRKYSTWAPSSCRVRSPIQGKWVQRLYHLPGRRGTCRVCAARIPGAGPRGWCRNRRGSIRPADVPPRPP